MRYYNAPTTPYVSQYVGSKYSPDLYLKAGAILEDRLNQAEAANAKFQETGELTPGRFTQLSGEAEAFNQKTRQYKEQATQAAANDSARELTDILLKAQQHLNSSQASKIKQDLDYTQKLAPELMKEGPKRIVKGDTLYNSSMQLDPSLYQIQSDTYGKEARELVKSYWNPDVVMKSLPVQPTGQYDDNGDPLFTDGQQTITLKDASRKAFAKDFTTIIDNFGPTLNNYGDFTGIPYASNDQFKDLSQEKGTASKNSPNSNWSAAQEAAYNYALDEANTLFYTDDRFKLDYSGSGGSTTPPAKKPRGLEIPHVLGEQFPSSQERGFAEKPIENYSDFEGNYKKLTSPENVYGDVITKYVGDEKTSKALIALLQTNPIEDVVGKIAEVLPEDQVNSFIGELAEKEAQINDIKEDMDLVNLDVSERAKQGLKLPIDDKGNVNVPKDLLTKANRTVGYLSPSDVSDLNSVKKSIEEKISPPTNYRGAKPKAVGEPEKQLNAAYSNLIKNYNGDTNSLEFKKEAVNLYNNYWNEVNPIPAEEQTRLVHKYLKESNTDVGRYFIKKDELMKEHFNDPKFQLKGWTPKEFGIKSKGSSVGDVIKDAAISSLEIFPHVNPKTGEHFTETDLNEKVFKTEDGKITMVGIPDFSTATLFPDVANGRFMLRYDAYPTEADAKERKNKESMYVDVTTSALQELQKDYPQEALAFTQKHEMWQELKNLPSEKTKTADKIFDVSGDAAKVFEQIKVERRGDSYFIHAPKGWDDEPGKAYDKEEILGQLWKTKVRFSGASEEVAPGGKFTTQDPLGINQ